MKIGREEFMKKIKPQFTVFILLVNVFRPMSIQASPEDLSQNEAAESENDSFHLESTSAILMEGSTGQVIYEKK